MENENDGQYLEDMLEESIAKQIEYLDTLTPGSEEHTAASRTLCEMYRVWIESNKVELEFNQRNEMQAMETALEDAKLKQQRKQQLLETAVQLGLGLVGIGAPLAFYGIWLAKGFKFEETGTFTSSTFKNFFRLFKPTKF